MERRETSFFRGSELPRLLALVAVLAIGLLVFWRMGGSRPLPAAPPAVVGEPLKPVEPDRSTAFESVVDRAPMSLRDNAAYDLLLKRARERTPGNLAAESRRDVLLTHLWERPGRYRGVPVHLDGTALRSLRYESRLSRTGWLYEIWVETEDSGRYPYVCIFEEAPRGFPLGANISERVVFNGYFLKIMKYEAGDVARGAPVLIGRVGWDAAHSNEARPLGSGSLLQWTLILLGIMFIISLARWIAAMGRSMGRRGRPSARSAPPAEEIDPAALAEWVREAGAEGEGEAPGEPEGGIIATEGPVASEDSGARTPDEAQSKPSPGSGD